jgi:hypothetical protein
LFHEQTSSAITGPINPAVATNSADTTSQLNALALDLEAKRRPLQRMPSVSDVALVKKSSIGSSVPGPSITSVRQQKSILSSKFKSIGDDFELVEHGELDEDFEDVSSEGPSASNGTAQPDPDVISWTGWTAPFARWARESLNCRRW